MDPFQANSDVTGRIGQKSVVQRENATVRRRRSLDQCLLRSAHPRERSEVLDERECCSCGVSRIRSDHTGLREGSVELLMLHLVEQQGATSIRIQRIVQQ